jgi:hypothetical protein
MEPDWLDSRRRSLNCRHLLALGHGSAFACMKQQTRGVKPLLAQWHKTLKSAAS